MFRNFTQMREYNNIDINFYKLKITELEAKNKCIDNIIEYHENLDITDPECVFDHNFWNRNNDHKFEDDFE